ncbi:enolase 4 isoform X2 [Conger conger]|uniref:enolase 4 isoform X2 n=1 Tax=Conger conger TaxID=82655 RepID=UPI002A5AA733|nr:enolase 4 isoform X2 [Conger conger]
MSYNGYFRTNSKIYKQDREFYDLKNRAVEYYRANGVPQKMEVVLNEMFFEKPDDVYGYLANYFSRLSRPPVINRVFGKEVYDGKGQLTVQAEVFCTVRNEEKTAGWAVISSHTEPRGGAGQNPGSANGNDRRKEAVMTAVRWINDSLCPMLKGFEPGDQTGVDKLLSDFYLAHFLEDQERQAREKDNQQSSEPVPEPATPPKSAVKDKKGKKNSTEKPIPPAEPPVPVLPGSVAVGTVSLAVAKAGAEIGGVPLYHHITTLKRPQFSGEIHMPLPMVTVLSCGRLSPGKLNLMEEVMVLPKAGQTIKQPALNAVSDSGALVIGYDRPEQPLDLISEASHNLGFVLGDVMSLAINCAGHELMDYQKGKYDAITGSPKSPNELVELYESLTSKYPAVIALIDPFRKEDQEQWERLSSVLGNTYLLSEAVSKTSGSHTLPGTRGFILQQTNEVTVTDLIHLTRQLEGAVTVVGTTNGEPCDDSLSDLAVGLGVTLVKLGGLYHGERLTKYNRLISIEEELAQQGRLGMAFSLSVFSAPQKGGRQSRGGGGTEIAGLVRMHLARSVKETVCQESEGRNRAKCTLALLIGHLITHRKGQGHGTVAEKRVHLYIK